MAMTVQQAEQQVIESVKQQFESVSGSFFLTNPKSHVLYANQALRKRKGLSLAQVVGKKPGQLWGGQMSIEFYKEFWKIIYNDMAPFVGTMYNRDENQETYIEDIYVAPLSNSSGDLKYFIEINPQFSSTVDQKKISEQFLEYWSGTSGDNINSLKTIYSWLHEGTNSNIKEFGARIDLLADAGYSLTDTLSCIFVEPTQELFLNRHEDRQLIIAAQANSDAFIELYLKYYDSIFYYFYKRLSETSVAEDFAHEVFLRAYKNIRDFNITNSSYYTYLKRISHNLLLNYYRKKEDILIENEILNLVIPYKNNYTIDLERTFLWKIVESLPRQYSDIVIKKYRKGMTIKELAQEYDKSENAIKLILSRARKKLRKLLK